MMRFDKKNKSDCPYYGCIQRVPEPRCHTTCQRYKAWKIKQEEKNEEARKKKGDFAMSDAKRKAIWRKQRYSKRKNFSSATKDD